MLACNYANASTANYTSGLISRMRNKQHLKIRLVSSHCQCLSKFPERRFALIEKCSLVGCPYLDFPFSKRKILGTVMHSTPKRIIDFFRGFSFLKASRDCDIIHYQQSSGFSFGALPLIPIILFSRQKKVVTFHSPGWGQKISFFFRLYNRVDRIIVHSESMKTYLINMGVEKSRIIKVPHGVNIPPLFGVDRTEITFMGAPEERKGILTILDALRILKDKNLNIKVRIYGFYDHHEKQSVESLAASKKVDDCLVWGGRLGEMEFDKKLQQSIFTFAVYNSDTSGSSIVTRAMSNATPVIATDIGGLKEYLDGGGVYLQPKDPEGLANIIESLLKDPQLLEKLGTKGRQRAQKLLSWKEIANRTINIYKSLVRDD